jgi:hypothetical protein
MIQVTAIFCDVQDFHRQHVAHEISDHDADVVVQRIAKDLDTFAENLPPEVRLIEENAVAHAEKGLGLAFIALHLGFHYYSTLLYFHYLDLHLDVFSNEAEYAARCRHHAASFSDLISLSKKIPRCEAVYFIVAHMTVVSSAALLHTLLFGSQAEVDETHTRLENNFSKLVELRQYWQAVDHLVRHR